jgi:hypothetical protein
MRCLKIALVLSLLALFEGLAFSDSIYRCGEKNGVPWFTINYKPKGVKCERVMFRRDDEPRLRGAKCTSETYGNTVFFRCQKDDIVWFFNKPAVASRGGVGQSERNSGIKPVEVPVPAHLDDMIGKASNTYNIPVSLIKALIFVESSFKPDAVSVVGAQGLMQLMPTTVDMLDVGDPFDPEENIMAGTKLLRRLLDRFDQDLDRALAAYYLGPSAVSKRSPIPERAQGYVAKVRRLQQKLSEGLVNPQEVP